MAGYSRVAKLVNLLDASHEKLKTHSIFHVFRLLQGKIWSSQLRVNCMCNIYLPYRLLTSLTQNCSGFDLLFILVLYIPLNS